MTDAFERASDGSLLLSVHVQPGASRSEVVGRHGDVLKLRVAAAPERGRANQATIELLATAFGVSRSQVEIVAGQASRRKKIRFAGVDEVAFRRRLGSLLAG